MSMQNINQLIDKIIRETNHQSPPQRASLLHILIYCLQQNHRYQSSISQGDNLVAKVIDELQKGLDKYATVESKKDHELLVSFVPKQAVENYQQFAQNHPEQSRFSDSVMYWLLEGDFQDNLLKWGRDICKQQGLDTLYLMPSFSDLKVSDLGFGTFIDNQWIGKKSELEFVGRERDINQHLGFLSLAIRQRKHYLLQGFPGVGKSLFLNELLKNAIQRWSQSGDSLLTNIRFILFQKQDFIYSEEDNRTRLTRLYQYLQVNPQIIPVFDSFESILNPALSVCEIFTSLFGSILATSGRTFILVCRTSTADSNLLDNVQKYTLSALSAADTLKIVKQKMTQLIDNSGLSLNFETSEHEFCSLLINTAKERYPGRFFPEIALHLAESTVNRTINRITYLENPPLDKIIYADLWEHVAEEQSISTEILGKDPDEFYQKVEHNLKKQVIAQDPAIEKVCKVLQIMAKRPPRKQPRGRFLFVGPPGVGKTHLGRQLAINLGLGDEAFFIFNMSEYSSDSARTRFMGSDPGYVGFSTTRTIYTAVKSKPSCVILLDEIDRAHASIQDILLSILEGEGKDAEGEIVYFSQVIFIMTTNQGQEQVEESYRKTLIEGISRAELVNSFNDETLRQLILEGAIDETEIAMQQHLLAAINSVKNMFNEQIPDQLPNNSHSEYQEVLIERYVDLKNRYNRLEYAQKKTPLDRAFLDRIDFVIPFFPIKEEKYLKQILNLTLKKYEWNDCPEEIKEKIIRQALEPKQSVRSLERLVMKYLSEV